jgi:hypothetical protein
MTNPHRIEREESLKLSCRPSRARTLLTPFERRKLIDQLLSKVRAVRLSDVADAWFSGCENPRRAALASFQRLQKAGFLRLDTTMAVRAAMLEGPLFEWNPGDVNRPNLSRIVWQARKRWCVPPRRTSIVTSANTSHLRRCRMHEMEHDLLTAQVFLWFELNYPAITDFWISEDEIAQEFRETGSLAGQIIPDAEMRLPDQASIAIEVIGRGYSVAKVSAIFEAHRHRPLQLW